MALQGLNKMRLEEHQYGSESGRQPCPEINKKYIFCSSSDDVYYNCPNLTCYSYLWKPAILKFLIYI
jgi:hypothetical protein